MTAKIILVGGGNMGHALLSGWLRAGHCAPGDIVLVEPATALHHRADLLGVTVVATAALIPAEARPALVVFAVKPQTIADVAQKYARFADTAVFLSILAGIEISWFRTVLGQNAAIVRCMPNTAAAVAEGMMVIVANEHVSPTALALVEGLLAANGRVLKLESENLIDAVTAVSGSGPAYFFHLTECLEAAGEAVGLPKAAAAALARQTLIGAAALMRGSPLHPAELRAQVTSPNGTTAAALYVLNGPNGLASIIGQAVIQARRRAWELRADPVDVASDRNG